jgi:hypothetical protein
MGLDTYASRSAEEIILNEEDLLAFEAAEISLCGGILSGNDGSFRGKIYSSMIMDVTSQGLYQDWIAPETVQEMYQALLDFDPEDAYFYDLVSAEVLELRKFFKVCCEQGLGLIGSW